MFSAEKDVPPVITTPPPVIKVGPTFSRPLSNTTASSGENAILECSVPGDSSTQIAWRKNGLVIGQMFDFKQTYIDGVARLEIRNCCAQDCGKYECVATSGNGEVSTSCLLTVIGKHFVNACFGVHIRCI